jgi:hypothetical protein
MFFVGAVMLMPKRHWWTLLLKALIMIEYLYSMNIMELGLTLVYPP